MIEDKTCLMLQEVLKEVTHALNEVAKDILWYNNQTSAPTNFLIKKALALEDQVKTIEEAIKQL